MPSSERSVRLILHIYNTWDDVNIVPYGNLILLCIRDDVGIVPYGNLIFLCKRDDVGIVPYEIVCLIKNQVYNAEDVDSDSSCARFILPAHCPNYFPNRFLQKHLLKPHPPILPQKGFHFPLPLR